MNSATTTIVHILVLLACCTFQSTSMRQRAIARCGRQVLSPNTRIVGGVEVEPFSWPWMVSLDTSGTVNATSSLRNIGHTCGGVLLNKDWVLTAAHCLNVPGLPNTFPRTPPAEWRVTAGMHNRDANASTASRWQRRGVLRFYIHPQFRDATFYANHDIALMQLDQPITFNAWVRPICLPNRRVTPPGWNRCYTAGWGTTAENGDQYSITLRQTEIPIINYFTCHYRYRSAVQPQQHICGGDWYNGNKDSCKGDSGGPLACQLDDGSWYVAGIVSWGLGCGRPGTPGVYTNVRSYEDFILSVMLYFSPESTRTSQLLRTSRSTDGHSSFMERLYRRK